MTEDEISDEYKAAKDEFEAAESALARARHRLHFAKKAMSELWDKRVREAEAKSERRYR